MQANNEYCFDAAHIAACLGAQGLGEELAICFASHGAKLILSARNTERLEVHTSLSPCCPALCTAVTVKVS